MSQTKAQTLGSGLKGCEKLQYIILPDNKLTGSLAAINELDQVKEIDISNNDFNYFPFSPQKLINLEKLSIDNNHIALIPSDIACCNKLIELNASNNQLITIPHGIQKLDKLEKLDVSHNKLQDPESSKMQAPQNIKKIYLNHNKLTKSFFSNMENLDLDVLYTSNNMNQSSIDNSQKSEKKTSTVATVDNDKSQKKQPAHKKNILGKFTHSLLSFKNKGAQSKDTQLSQPCK